MRSHGLRCRNGLQPVAEIISLDKNSDSAKVASLFEAQAKRACARNSPSVQASEEDRKQ